MSALAHFSQEEIAELLSKAEKNRLAAGDTLIREGEPADALYYIESGQAAVAKNHQKNEANDYFDQDLSHRFKIFGAGQWVGESSFIDNKQRTQTVQAIDDMVVYRLDYQTIRQLSQQKMPLFQKTIDSLYQHLACRIRRSNQIITEQFANELASIKKSAYLEHVLVKIFFILCLLLFSFELLTTFYSTYGPTTRRLFTCGLILAITAVGYFGQRPALTFFGFHRKKLFQSLCLGLLVSLFLCILAVWAKQQLITRGLINTPLLSPPHYSNLFKRLIMISTYCVFSILQEFIARGIMQTALCHVLRGRYAPLNAIIMSNMAFASMHSFIFGFVPSALLFFVGLFWGWIYQRSGNIWGAILSHILFGVFAVDIMGIPKM